VILEAPCSSIGIEPDQCAPTEIRSTVRLARVRQNEREYLQPSAQNRFEYSAWQKTAHMAAMFDVLGE
jgi:hypothetical protein